MALCDDAVYDEAGQQRDDQGYDVVDAEQHHRAGHTRKVGFAVWQDPCEVACLSVAIRIDVHT